MARHPEPLIFCLAWAALALVAGLEAGWKAGALLSVGLMLLIMPAGILIVTRTENLELERAVRWALLGLAALLYHLWRAG